MRNARVIIYRLLMLTDICNGWGYMYGLPGKGKGAAVTNPNITAPTVERLLTYKQTGNLLGVTERTIWTLVDQGELPAVRFGRSVRIDPADLRAYIDRRKTTMKGGEYDPR